MNAHSTRAPRRIAVATLAAACIAAALTTAAEAAAKPAPLTRNVAAHSTRAAQKSGSATGVAIAIVDTGVTAIPELSGRLVAGVDLTNNGSTSDGNGHGTAMASIAAGQPAPGNNAGGVCQTCTILPVRAVGSAGLGTTQLAAAGVTWAAAHGARVINLSLTTSAEDPALTAAINNAVNAGIVVVVAAGNSGSGDPSAQGYPGAGTAEAITVASANGLTSLYPWSNSGSWVQLAAPGSLTASTTTGKPFAAIGTSGSAAYVSGLVGQMLSCNPGLTPAQVQSILLSTGTPFAPLGSNGHVVNVAAAAAAAACPAA
ncbi:MAG TPA: S8 family serine peptidase [Gaiellaceae bacterium]|nr:S8 family serine peptidase [Gaiellaceae bacterium]